MAGRIQPLLTHVYLNRESGISMLPCSNSIRLSEFTLNLSLTSGSILVELEQCRLLVFPFGQSLIQKIHFRVPFFQVRIIHMEIVTIQSRMMSTSALWIITLILDSRNKTLWFYLLTDLQQAGHYIQLQLRLECCIEHPLKQMEPQLGFWCSLLLMNFPAKELQMSRSQDQ